MREYQFRLVVVNMKTIGILLMLSFSAALMTAPMASANPCNGTYDTGCEEGAYTWCSPNQSGDPGYRSYTGYCSPGYQAQPVRGNYCAVWIAPLLSGSDSTCIS